MTRSDEDSAELQATLSRSMLIIGAKEFVVYGNFLQLVVFVNIFRQVNGPRKKESPDNLNANKQPKNYP